MINIYPNHLIGVERERFIVDKKRSITPAIGILLPKVKEVAKERGVLLDLFDYELESSQIEDRTRPCETIADVRKSLLQNDEILSSAASKLGLDYECTEYVDSSRFKQLVVNPFNERHQQIFKERDYETLLAASQVAGIHIHFGVNLWRSTSLS